MTSPRALAAVAAALVLLAPTLVVPGVDATHETVRRADFRGVGSFVLGNGVAAAVIVNGSFDHETGWGNFTIYDSRTGLERTHVWDYFYTLPQNVPVPHQLKAYAREARLHWAGPNFTLSGDWYYSQGDLPLFGIANWYREGPATMNGFLENRRIYFEAFVTYTWV